MKNYKIGTRGSLLALTQTQITKDLLEKTHNDSFEIVVIKTQGDENTSVPLWQMDGKDFFTKELDEALLSGKVDLVIHSYKDLGSERPAGLAEPILPARSFANDIVLLNKDRLNQLKETPGTLTIGTSSPRRTTNIQNHLAKYLPFPVQGIQCTMLRGNVNTRIEKLKSGQYDGIVLALAGLERLATLEKSRTEIAPLLAGLQYIVLPHSKFPAAASQGALALVCAENRNDDGELLRKLNALADPKTIAAVTQERAAFQSYGGGCHLAVGIHCRAVANSNFHIHYHRGEADGKTISIQKLTGKNRPKAPQGPHFLGLPPKKAAAYPDFVSDHLILKRPIPYSGNTLKGAFFVTSDHCLTTLKSCYGQGSIWAAGDKTMQSLVQQGYWVNGSADGFGDSEIQALSQSKALKLFDPSLATWHVLTGRDSPSQLGATIPCYEREFANPGGGFLQKLQACKVFFWVSFPQYEMYVQRFHELANKIHCCGVGKTWQNFASAKIDALPFLDIEDYVAWCQA